MKVLKRFFLFAMAGLLLNAGCTEPNLGYIPGPSLPGDCRAGTEVTETFNEFEQSGKLDILFVVDASGNSQKLLEKAQAASGPFLKRFEDADLSVRVGVVTTEKGAKIRKGDGCKTTIADSENKDWRDQVSCNFGIEVDDDKADEPLSVIVSLLEHSLWRERSKRLVIVLTRDDDCSGGNVSSEQPREACMKAKKDKLDIYQKSFRSSVQSAEGFTLAVLSGPSLEDERLRPVCNAVVGNVYSANRLYELTESMGVQGVFINLCTGDLRFPFFQIADHVLKQGVSLCPSREMAHEPLRVVDGEDAMIPVGKDGFVYSADRGACEKGTLVFDHSSSSALEEVKVTYCAL